MSNDLNELVNTVSKQILIEDEETLIIAENLIIPMNYYLMR